MSLYTYIHYIHVYCTVSVTFTVYRILYTYIICIRSLPAADDGFARARPPARSRTVIIIIFAVCAFCSLSDKVIISEGERECRYRAGKESIERTFTIHTNAARRTRRRRVLIYIKYFRCVVVVVALAAAVVSSNAARTTGAAAVDRSLAVAVVFAGRLRDRRRRYRRRLYYIVIRLLLYESR